MKKENSIGIGLLGLGTVGKGVVDIIQNAQELLATKSGCTIRIIAAAVRDKHAPRDCDLEGVRLSEDIQSVIHDPEVDIVIELIGGETEALEAIESALNVKKPVITANKALLAKHSKRLYTIAQAQGVPLLFEAAVAGGIPIIKVMREGLNANNISRIAGIINGTCNYILTRMLSDEMGFSSVLADAQRLGYAEADPEFDVEGIDAAHKLTLLAALATNQNIDFDQVYTEGITRITLEDLHQVETMGYSIKHLGIADITGDTVSLRVHPALLRKENPLATVSGVMNAVFVESDMLGESMYYGPGAGRLPTASAVVADICEIARCTIQNIQPPLSSLSIESAVQYQSIEHTSMRYYLRLNVMDKPGVMRCISDSLAKHNISMEFVHQSLPEIEGGEATVFIMTNLIQENELRQGLQSICEQVSLCQAPFFIRVF